WHPKGMQLFRILMEKWRSFLLQHGFEEVGGTSAKEYFALSGREKFCFFSDWEDHIFSFEKESLISCLQIIEKWIKIFDFKVKWILLSSRQKKLVRALKELKIDYVEEPGEKSKVEVHIADGLGRFWCGPSLECEKEMISFSLFGNLTRFMALILEKTEGRLPFWMCPEQVRLLPLGGVDFGSVLEIYHQLQIRYTVDRDKSPLKEKMHRALRAKVPYVMVFGKQEEKTEKMKIRAYGNSHEQTLTLQQMQNFLAEQKLESQ
ncbi:MAG: hypothetical protein K1000chlam3_01519, partial [Chlamydiae bacterium]|nr:hypothetical protein [Chlamydiota bacterium]